MALNAFTGAQVKPVQAKPVPAPSVPGLGGGKKKRGLYHGKAGAAASNQDPLTFFQTAGRLAGISTGANTSFDDWFNNFYAPRMVGDYNAALAGNEHLSAKKFLKQNFGVTGIGSKGLKNLNPGQLSLTATGPGSLADEFDIYDANTNQAERVGSNAIKSGDIANNGNQAYQDFITQSYTPQLQAEFKAQQGANPLLNFRDFMNAQDPERMRRAFANRAPSLRQPSAFAPGAGRWSWWA